MNWIRIRNTRPLQQHPSGKQVRFLIAEREDGGVFFQSYSVYGDARDEVSEQNARLQLDYYLSDPLDPKSVGQFDMEPNIYIPGMSPARFP